MKGSFRKIVFLLILQWFYDAPYAGIKIEIDFGIAVADVAGVAVVTGNQVNKFVII